jgi:pimeloyl-ACP methyl ester carboxylesterase
MPRSVLVNLGDGLAARIAPGDGERVLWIHGYTLDSGCWEPLWQLLPNCHHLGVDLPGHGASLPFRAGEGLPALARRIGERALAHGVRHLVAHSIGTLVALQIAIEFPGAFATVVLGAPTFGGGPEDPQVFLLYDALQELYRAQGFGPELRDRWMRSPPYLFRGAEAQPELWQRLWAIVGRHPWWELGDGSLVQLCRHSQLPVQIRQIEAALLLLVGEHELESFKRAAELIRRSAVNCRRVYLPEVGHLCMLSDPNSAYPIIERHFQSYAEKSRAITQG